MLREIYIKNFILIDELRLELGRGLNVLTGETGSGKSIVVDALELLVGERISSELVRNPEEKSVVEGVIEVAEDSPLVAQLEELGLWDDGEELLVIRREIGKQGRVVNRINGSTVTAGVLKGLAEYLVDLHLQHDNQQILNPRVHISILDTFSTPIKEIMPLLSARFSEWKKIKNEIDELLESEKRRAQELDMLSFQVEEIDKAALVDGEEDDLAQERNRMMNAERFSQAAQLAEQLLYSDALSAHSQVARVLDNLRRMDDPFFKELTARLEDVYHALDDTGHEIARFASQLEFDPQALEAAEERLQVISKLKKKYGDSVQEIMIFLQNAREQKSVLENLETRVEELKNEQTRLWEQYLELAARTTELRREAANALVDRIHRELADLAMPGVRFDIEMRKAEPGANGMDEVTFLFSANPGEDLRPIARIASGGEISRFILALKSAVADAYQVPVLVFDEIDVGVGGQALLAVGEKLYQLSNTHQVIVVTHSPQIASLAHNHLRLTKEFVAESTRVQAEPLDQEGRVEELSRMLAGEKVTEAAREHARQMLMQASDRR
ncbi:MAG: DNA repair protein RecN [Candidatus Saccharibacteria bacterium]